jgi:hypothetical protein
MLPFPPVSSFWNTKRTFGVPQVKRQKEYSNRHVSGAKRLVQGVFFAFFLSRRSHAKADALFVVKKLLVTAARPAVTPYPSCLRRISVLGAPRRFL